MYASRLESSQPKDIFMDAFDNFLRTKNKDVSDYAAVLINILGRIIHSLCRLRSNKVFPSLDDNRVMEVIGVKFGESTPCYPMSGYSKDTRKVSGKQMIATFEDDVSNPFVTHLSKGNPRITADRYMVDLLVAFH